MRRRDSDSAEQSRSPRFGWRGEVNGDPFSTGVKHAVRRDEAEERRKGGEIASGLRNMTSKSVSHSTEEEGRQSMQSIRYGEWGSPQKVSPERNAEFGMGDFAFVRSKLFLNPS